MEYNFEPPYFMAKNKTSPRKIREDILFFVELAGIEPASAQGNHTLSTCLFQTSIFEQQQDLDHQLLPYPLNFIRQPRLYLTISDLPAPLNP